MLTNREIERDDFREQDSIINRKFKNYLDTYYLKNEKGIKGDKSGIIIGLYNYGSFKAR